MDDYLRLRHQQNEVGIHSQVVLSVLLGYLDFPTQPTSCRYSHLDLWIQLHLNLR